MTQNSVNLNVTNNADGFDATGGTTPRKLTLSGGNVAVVGAGVAVVTFPSADATLATLAGTETLTNKTMTGVTNTLTASVLKSATTEVSVSAATAPSSGQLLTATASTTATWQAPATQGTSTLTNPGDTTNANGLVEKWGSSVVTLDASGNGTVTFAIAFPTAVFTTIVCNGDPGVNATENFIAGFTTTSTLLFSLRANPGAVTIRVNWRVTGH